MATKQPYYYSVKAPRQFFSILNSTEQCKLIILHDFYAVKISVKLCMYLFAPQLYSIYSVPGNMLRTEMTTWIRYLPLTEYDRLNNCPLGCSCEYCHMWQKLCRFDQVKVLEIILGLYWSIEMDPNAITCILINEGTGRFDRDRRESSGATEAD